MNAQVNWEWNEELLESIRNDAAKPVVHARNLYHHSMGMYNIHDQLINGGESQLDPAAPSGEGIDLDKAWSGFSYAFISNRYADSPGWAQIQVNLDELVMSLHGEDWASLSNDPSAIYGYDYGVDVNTHFMFDGANQDAGYVNTCYTPSNNPVDAETPGSCVSLDDAAHWQPLAFGVTAPGNADIHLTLTLDDYGSETTWSIDGPNGNVGSGGPYSNTTGVGAEDNETFVFEFDVPADCYTLTVNDEYGNGLQYVGVVGNYTLTDGSGNVLAQMVDGGDFGYQAVHEFCVAGTPGFQDFLGANWGDVLPFALDIDNSIQVERDGCVYRVYEDPGAPEYLEDGGDSPYSYINGFATVVSWQQHLNPQAEDDEYMDISPRSQGNFGGYPDVPEIYYSLDGANLGPGHAFNPITNQPYVENMVLRSDFTRVLPEFWADGPNSETPPGHWFSIMNHDVFAAPEFVPNWRGEVLLSNEEWLARAYLLMGGAFHDCSIAAWGIKASYDFIRPISAIRHMQSLGQSTDPTLASYHEHGLPLIEGVIEVIESGDPLLLEFPSSEGEIKVKQWIPNADPAMPASFDWRPGCHWLPYQLPSFVTPPFAGYVSGHSTFSAAAAELLATMTGSPFFPGGMGSFSFDPSYLNFDVGPSESFDLQWATYKDAADQSGLSRIWGGIHPPVDDIRGRIIGDNIADQCLELGANLFEPNQSGCTYADAMNYDSSITQDDGSCLFAFEDPCPGDLNGDSEVDVHDLLDLFVYFGNICD
ncbi:MAG: vanadium-dependent haloperoxidase [Bacteroidetes bacterium]|nr:vanadium-dependent haloperoxidase [Bacteroidota bacterium]